MSAERCLGFVAIGVLFTISVVETFYFPLSRSFSSIPMLVGLVTIGMGHGAFDSELIFGGGRRSESIWLFLRYTGVMLLAALGFWFFPVLAIVAFLLFAMIHFGKEDSESNFNPVWRADTEVCRREPTNAWPQEQTATGKMIRSLRLSHGWLVIAVPLAASPIESAEFFRRVEWSVGHAATRFPWEIAIAGPILVITTAVILAMTMVNLWPQRSRLRRWAIEFAVIAFAAISLHPEFFIGLYLLAWHAPKHILDLRTGRAMNRRGVDDQRSIGIMRGIFGSLPFLLPAWVAVGALAWGGGGDVPDVTAAGIRSPGGTWMAKVSAATVAVYIVVTLPHHLMQCGWLKPGLKRGVRNLARALAGESVPAGSCR